MHDYATTRYRGQAAGSPTCTSSWHRPSSAIVRPLTVAPSRSKSWLARGATHPARTCRRSHGASRRSNAGIIRRDRCTRAARWESEHIGGSRAQHDLIEFTLLKAYLEANRLEEARSMLRARRPGASGVPVAGIAAFTDIRTRAAAAKHARQRRHERNNRMSGSIAQRQVGACLGQFIAGSSWDALPPTVLHEAKRSLLNFAGCALGVAASPPIEMALRVLLPLSGSDRVTLIGRKERLDPLGAAFLNAIGGNLLDYDDTHLRTVIHPTAPVAPPAFALGEQRKLSGQAVLHAFILGAEVECRIGNAVSPGHYARGWHITSTCGVFGAAAASARLLGLNAEQTGHALGIAASQSAGNVENLPSAAKNVSVGNAARNGLFAALLAEQGYTAAPAAIEGPLGWARAMGDGPTVGEMTDGLGERWELLKNTYKPYPCGIVMHAVIDACLALRREHALQPEAIAEITISGDQLLLDRGDRLVANERDARVSIQHCALVRE